ncbi:thioesterase family protein [Alphaproteobacteria bacterium]|nr:thioesterase family protein [Alphaproteobacteria bacterium]
MTPYSKLRKLPQKQGEVWKIDLTEDWLQGRTAYGGIIAALMLETIYLQIADLPPLRTAHFSFIGPASGTLSAHNTILRQGKNMITVESVISGEKGIGTKALFTFGKAIPAATDQDYPVIDQPESPESLPQLATPPNTPAFLQHIDRRVLKSAEFLSGTHHPEFLAWIRMNDPEAREGIAVLLALADGPPPAALAAVKSLTALSSINWTVNFLRDNPVTQDGWWLIRSKSQHVRHGYSSQTMQIWNRAGERVVDAIQHVAIFE